MNNPYTVTEIARSRLEHTRASTAHGLLVAIANCCRQSRLVRVLTSAWGRTASRCVDVRCA